MAVLKCKMCGGDLNITADETVVECEYCGSKQTVPTADNEKKMNHFARANRLLRNCEFDKAAGIYESIVAEFPEEAEAYWGLVLCKYGIEYVDDPATGNKVPTCHRSSFDSVMDDKDFELVMEYADGIARRVYREQTKQMEELRKAIIEVSGKEEPYDIFISYKETDDSGDRTLDSVIAQDIYTELNGKGYRVFFSRISLEDKLGTEYEPYIFAALNSAKVMLVVGTDYDHFNAVWVKNEWSRFLALIAKGEKKTLIPVFKNIDAYDMPKEFAKLSAQDMGKVGAMQDLLRGVDKIFGKTKSTTNQIVQEPIIREQPVEQNIKQSKNYDALVKRGFMALEDKEYYRADRFFEEVLNQNAECAEAHLGKMLIANKCASLREYASRILNEHKTVTYETLMALSPDTAHIKKMAETYEVKGFLEKSRIISLYDYDFSYKSAVHCRETQKPELIGIFKSDHLFPRVLRYADEEFKSKLKIEIDYFTGELNKRINDAKAEDAKNIEKIRQEYAAFLTRIDELVVSLHSSVCQKRECIYKDVTEAIENAATVSDYEDIRLKIDTLCGYKDSAELAEKCEAQIKKLLEEKSRKEKAERKAAEKKKIFAALIIFAVIAGIVSTSIWVDVINDKKQRNMAYELLNKGEYIAAYDILKELGENDVIAQSKYDRAEVLISQEHYTDAYMLLEEIGDTETIKSSKYSRAEKLLNNGDYENAYALLRNLDYEDSQAKATSILEEHPAVVQIGDIITFGEYEQDRVLTNGKEKIDWIVLDKTDDKILVISKYVLEVKKYHAEAQADITWRNCDLRSWLNKEFLKESFSTEEQKLIAETEIVTKLQDSSEGLTTKDKIFVLSEDEANKYFASDEKRICGMTVHARAQTRIFKDLYTTNDGKTACQWWLRTPGEYENSAEYVDTAGAIIGIGIGVHVSFVAVRPAMWINIE